MMSMSKAPPQILEIVQWAEERGMRLVREPMADPTGLLADYENKTLALQILYDRGDWFAEVGWVGWDEWFDADLWVSCLDRTEIGLEGHSLGEQIQILKERWDEMAAAPSYGLLSCLQRQQKYRAYRRLGFSL